ncbi:MAG: VWA domain-containing protein [bacterium]|nr:VWA domain-containing protein [bacterium]
MTQRILRAILACSLVFVSPLASPLSAAQDDDTAVLVAKIIAGEEGLDLDVFDIVGKRRSRMALNGLLDSAERAPIVLRPRAVHALRHFAGVPQLEGSALKFLAGYARADGTFMSRPAARALVAFGAAAVPALEAVMDDCPDELTRQIAVGGLVDVLSAAKTKEALELLLDHYRPGVSGPSHVGARALGAFRDDKSQKTLHAAVRSSKTPEEVRAMVVAAVALHPGDKTTALLKKAMGGKSPIVAVAAIDAMRNRGESHLPTLERLKRKGSAAVRCAAFRALASARLSSPDFHPHLVRAVGGDDFALRLGAALALAEGRDDTSGELLVELIGDRHPTVRRRAMEGANRRRLRAAIPHLIARLEHDSVRLRPVAHQALVELTGLDHGEGVKRWKLWWEGEHETFTLPARGAALEAARVRRAARASAPTKAAPKFYGLRYDSDRVVFVLDISGSMRDERRLERMQREMLAAIDATRDGEYVNMIFFESYVSAWQPHLVRMDEQNRKRARRAVRELRELGGTNMHDALKAAFRDPEVDTIVLLSDGEPTEGISNPRSIIRNVRRWNELRGVVIHCVAVGWDGSVLEALTSETGGEMVFVR